MRPLTLAVLAIGLLLGPGYFLYTRYLTGSVVGTYPLASDDGKGLASVALTLSPAMSPARVILRLSAEHGPSYIGTPTAAPRNRYRAVVTHDGEVVAENSFELVSSSLESSFQELAQVAATLEVGAAGEYRVQVEESGEPQMRVTAASLELRRNVRDPEPRVVWGGVALVAVGILGLLLAR